MRRRCFRQSEHARALLAWEERSTCFSHKRSLKLAWWGWPSFPGHINEAYARSHATCLANGATIMQGNLKERLLSVTGEKPSKMAKCTSYSSHCFCSLAILFKRASFFCSNLCEYTTVSATIRAASCWTFSFFSSSPVAGLMGLLFSLKDVDVPSVSSSTSLSIYEEI